MLYVDVANRVTNECLDVRSDERVAIITDEMPGHPFVACLSSAIRSKGADVVVVGTERVSSDPHGYLTWREPSSMVTSLLKECDIAVVYMSSLIALSEAARSAAARGTRMLFIPADFDLRRPMVLDEDLGALAVLGDAVTRRLREATKIRLTSDEGTDLTLRAGGAVTYDDCRVTAPGDIDFFPGGMWNVVPDIDSVSGVVRFTGALHPVGRLVDPIELRFEGGTLTGVTGGWQARSWERWLRSFGDQEVTRFAHLSGGLSSRAQVIGHDWEDLIVRGSVIVAGGASLLYGGRNGASAHFDGIVPNATLHLDDEELIVAGEYVQLSEQISAPTSIVAT